MKLVPSLAGIVIAGHVLLLACSAAIHSPTYDEVGHMAAGLYTWQTGRFDLFRVNPPLVRTLATAPVYLAGGRIDLDAYDAALRRPEFFLGVKLIERQSDRIWEYYVLARWTSLGFSVLGACFCYRLARRLYGPWAGLLATVLWCCDSTVMGHAALMTPDVPAAALSVAALTSFLDWTSRPSIGRLITCGIWLGLAQTAKFTLLALYPLLFVWWLWQHLQFAGAAGLRRGFQSLAAICCISLAVINLAYCCEGVGKSLGQFTFISRALNGMPDDASVEALGNRFTGMGLGWLPVPVPENWLLGIDEQRQDFEARRWSYLRGEWRLGGWWYYYFYALLIKESPCILLLFFLTIVWTVIRRIRGWQTQSAESLCCALCGLGLLALVSSQTGINHHIRYVLPALPFAMVWCGQLLEARLWRIRWARTAVLVIAASLPLSIARTFPHSLSYFNFLVGGPALGYHHLLHSNTDWGQDWWRFQDWLRRHPEVKDVWVAYDTPYDPRHLGLTFRLAPPAPTAEVIRSNPQQSTQFPPPGWYCASVNQLRSLPGAYSYLDTLEPVDRIGGSLRIYYVAESPSPPVFDESFWPE